MLTLLETTQAIKALKTDKSILIQACQNVLTNRSPESTPYTSDSLAREITLLYHTQLEPHEFIMCLCSALAISASILAKDGCEAEMLSHIRGLLTSEFKAVTYHKFQRLMETDPEKGIEQLLSLLEKSERKN